MCFARFSSSAFRCCTVGMAGTWPGLLRAFDVRRIFWWLDLISSTQLVGLMFSICYRSSIHIFLIGSNGITHHPYRCVFNVTVGCVRFAGQGHAAAPLPHLVNRIFLLQPALRHLWNRCYVYFQNCSAWKCLIGGKQLFFKLLSCIFISANTVRRCLIVTSFFLILLRWLEWPPTSLEGVASSRMCAGNKARRAESDNMWRKCF